MPILVQLKRVLSTGVAFVCTSLKFNFSLTSVQQFDDITGRDGRNSRKLYAVANKPTEPTLPANERRHHPPDLLSTGREDRS